MSDHSIHRATGAIDAQTMLPWLAALAVYLLLIALAPRLLADPDTYSHIALGRWILQHHQVPTGDPLSQTMRDVPWVAFEWLSQVVYAVAYRVGGWIGVSALAAAATAAAFWILARALLREWPPIPTLVALLAAQILLSPHLLARPHILALPLMVLWIASLIRALDTGRPPSWWLLPAMTLWANLHGSFTFGIAMIGPIACEAFFNARDGERRRVTLQWLGFAALALAAACINPYGPEMILVTFRTVALGEALTTISEWRPQDFGAPGAFEVILLAGFGLALSRGVKLPLLRILMVFGILHLSLSQSRHADLLGMLAPIILARPLAAHFGERLAQRAVADVRLSAGLAVGAVLVAAVATALVAAGRDVTPPANITPQRAVNSINITEAGAILNDYDFGAYLEFVGIPPFIDGRTELYGAPFVMRHYRALNLQNLPDFLRLLEDYRIQTTLLTPQTPAVALLDRLPEWERAHADDIAVVHRRRARPDSRAQ